MEFEILGRVAVYDVIKELKLSNLLKVEIFVKRLLKKLPLKNPQFLLNHFVTKV